MEHKSAFISIVGRPNTGKSTLINALVGEKVAITSHHPNTTRHAIRGILSEDDFQLIFLDTPGLHKAKTPLGTALNRVVDESITDVDIVIQCIPAVEKVGDGDLYIARQLAGNSSIRRICVLTMIDMIGKTELPKQLMAISELAKKAGFEWDEIIPVSAFTDTQIQLLIDLLVKHSKVGPAFYPKDMKSDQELEKTISELIRESAIAGLFEEVPHSVAVVIDEMSEREDKKIFDIHASVIVERDSQKAILIGKGGENLKIVGTKARTEIEKKVGMKVFLKLHVKVISNWQKDPKSLQKLGLVE
ncbi:MAG: GTPase Era [Actinomycetales bacterium]|jgi:GTP-binding protein Era